jgi:enoyl-CoA hydratase/carnithine racemase
MSAPETILLGERDDGLRTITLNRPARRNAFNDLMLRELATAMADVNADPDAKVLVLRGSRQAFCSGRDLAELSEVSRREAGMPVPPAGGHESAMFRTSEIPTIAVAEGAVVGGGLGFLLQCDVKLVADDARLLDGHLPNGMISSVPSFYLPRSTSMANSLELLCSTDGVSGSRAAEMGVVDLAVPADEVEETLERLVAMLVRWDGELLRHTIRVLRTARTDTYESTMALVGVLRTTRRRRDGAGSSHA